MDVVTGEMSVADARSRFTSSERISCAGKQLSTVCSTANAESLVGLLINLNHVSFVDIVIIRVGVEGDGVKEVAGRRQVVADETEQAVVESVDGGGTVTGEGDCDWDDGEGEYRARRQRVSTRALAIETSAWRRGKAYQWRIPTGSLV